MTNESEDLDGGGIDHALTTMREPESWLSPGTGS